MTEAARRLDDDEKDTLDSVEGIAAARGVAKLGAARIRNPLEPVTPGTRDAVGTRGTPTAPATGSRGDTQKTADFRQFSDVGTRGTPGTRENDDVRWKSSTAPLTDHDAAEAAALTQHYAAPAGSDLPACDRLKKGLLLGWLRHRGGAA